MDGTASPAAADRDRSVVIKQYGESPNVADSDKQFAAASRSVDASPVSG